MKSYREKRIAEMIFMQKEEKEDEKEEKNNNFKERVRCTSRTNSGRKK